MTDPRDPVETWLGADVELMPPPPGAFERVHRRARQRKAARAMGAAACAAVLIAGVVVLPQVTGGNWFGTGGGPATVRGSSTPGNTHSPHRPTGSPRPGPSGTQRHGQSGALPIASAGRGGTPAAGFRPTSVTFIGTGNGGVIGAVLGQPGSGCTKSACTALAATPDYGTTWTMIGAPRAGAPRGASGASQVRFLNEKYGWAFGPALYATRNGGRTWSAVPIPGRVIDLSTIRGAVFAVAATCAGSSGSYYSRCSSFALYEAAARTGQFRTVGASANLPPNPGGLQLTAQGGYLLEDGHLFAGPVSAGAWHAVPQSAGAPPCLRSPGQGAAAGPTLLAPALGSLYLACRPAVGGAAGSGPLTLYKSKDAGRTWQSMGPIPSRGRATSLTAIPGGGEVLATTAGLYYSAHGTTWIKASLSAPAPGGFSYVGLTNTSQGVAIPSSPALGVVYTTADGGRTWQAHRIG